MKTQIDGKMDSVVLAMVEVGNKGTGNKKWVEFGKWWVRG